MGTADVAEQILYGRLARIPGKDRPGGSWIEWVDNLNLDQLFLDTAYQNQFGGFSGGDIHWMVAAILPDAWPSQNTADEHVLNTQDEYLCTLRRDMKSQTCLASFSSQDIDADLQEVQPVDAGGDQLFPARDLYANRHQLRAVEELCGPDGDWAFYHHIPDQQDECGYTELIYRHRGRLLGSVMVGDADLIRRADG